MPRSKTSPALRWRAGLAGVLIVVPLTACSSLYEAPSQQRPAEVRIDETHNGQDAPSYVGFPLGGPPPNGFTIVRPAGTLLTNGQLVLENLGDEPLRITSVKPSLHGDIDYLGASIAGADREIGFIQVLDAWPPTDDPRHGDKLGPVQPAVGAVVPPSKDESVRGVELLLGLRIGSDTRSTVKGVTVEYVGEKSGKRHKQTWVSTMAVCAPPTEMADCEPEYAGT